MKGRSKEIHVWSEGKYVGNIIYTYRVPLMSEEELEDTLLKTKLYYLSLSVMYILQG